MLSEPLFNELIKRAKMYTYSSMNYIDFEDVENAEILYDNADLILLMDKNKTPSMLYFSTNDFVMLVNIIADIPGSLRMHFVPREYASQLKMLGFTEWGEYTDFWNDNLAETAEHFTNTGKVDYLKKDECDAASALSHKCRLQSRGFEGETPGWFAEWLNDNKVIIQRKGSEIIGFCCVSIYNEGTTLWIREIAVDPAFQGTGIGKKLMEQAIRYGVENGAVKGFLAADVLNANAIGLYKKYHFHAQHIDSELQMIRE